MRRAFRGIQFGIAAVGDELVGVAVVNGQQTWSARTSWVQGESLEDCILRLLPVPSRRSRRPVVVVALGAAHSRVREIPGIPAGMSAADVKAFVETNQERFFVSVFEESVTTSGRQLDDGRWIAALVDAAAAHEAFKGCWRALYQLRAIIPGFGETTGAPHAEVADRGQKLDVHLQSALTAACHQSGDGLEFVPPDVIQQQQRSRFARLRVAAILFILGITVSWLGPAGRDLVREWQAEQQSSRLLPLIRPMLAQLDSVKAVTALIQEFDQQETADVHALQQLAAIELLLPEDAVLLRVDVDSTGVALTLATESVSTTVGAIAQQHPDAQIIGSISSEPAPSPRQRVSLLLPRKRTTPASENGRNPPRSGRPAQ